MRYIYRMIRIQNACEIDDGFYLPRTAESAADVVKEVLEAVRERGDEALMEYSAKFDHAAPHTLEIKADILADAARQMEQTDKVLFEAICRSRNMASNFARQQLRSLDNFECEIDEGLFAGQRCIPVDRAGVYVPAGRHPLVSTVIMTVVPAIIAGVKEVVLCTPPKATADGSPMADEGIMAAAWICAQGAYGQGETKLRVFAAGGAQAVAAMAYGTQSIPRVDVIVGPGNKFVAEAKRQVYGTVGIDMIAGPTEVFIIADKGANAEWVASDLLAQAEHDTAAQSVLATDDADFAQKVAAEVERQLAILPTREVAEKSINDYGRIIVTRSLNEAADIANRKAPEHLEIAIATGAAQDAVAAAVHNYGSLFIGGEAAEVLGDYAAGINHTLPTSQCARYTGGLSVRSFVKTVTTLRSVPHCMGTKRSAQTAAVLGDAEGLQGHARAARLRAEGGIA